MTTEQTLKFQKDRTSLKGYLLGHGYNRALRAMAFAQKYHTGLRKDGVTPEFAHQVAIAFSILNLRGVVNEETCIGLAFLHDTDEDYDVSHATMEREVGSELADKSAHMNKKNYNSEIVCMVETSKDIDCSIVKGADNGHNIQSMHGAFGVAKMSKYIERTKNLILPMNKQASYFFPEQSFAYSAQRHRLKDQIAIYEYFLKNYTTNEKP